MIITNDLEDIIQDTKQTDEKIHLWRICPICKDNDGFFITLRICNNTAWNIVW